MDVTFTPLSCVALCIVAVDGSVPSEWIGTLGQLGAAGAIIWAVKAFLARQETAAVECKQQVQAIVDANKETIAGIVASNTRSNDQFAEALAANTLEVSGLREGIGKIIDRNRTKDGEA